MCWNKTLRIPPYIEDNHTLHTLRSFKTRCNSGSLTVRPTVPRTNWRWGIRSCTQVYTVFLNTYQLFIYIFSAHFLSSCSSQSLSSPTNYHYPASPNAADNWAICVHVQCHEEWARHCCRCRVWMARVRWWRSVLSSFKRGEANSPFSIWNGISLYLSRLHYYHNNSHWHDHNQYVPVLELLSAQTVGQFPGNLSG